MRIRMKDLRSKVHPPGGHALPSCPLAALHTHPRATTSEFWELERCPERPTHRAIRGGWRCEKQFWAVSW